MLGLLVAASSAAVSAPRIARADEPRNATEPRVMMESGEVTNVIDAFDDGDLFDLNLSLGFEYSSKSARVRRETAIAEPGLSSGGFTSGLMNVGTYSQTISRLVPRIDIGIYKDFALHVSLPILLNNSQKLSPVDGSDAKAGVVLQGAPGEQLFDPNFQSPDRSGLEHIEVGLDLDLLNQHRDWTKPTWNFGISGRFSVGTPMHACNPKPNSGEVSCADPGDVNRNGQSDGKLDGASVGERQAGVTRGTAALEGHTILSKRIKYVEPYGGFAALFELQQKSSDYGLTDLDASLVNHPPFIGTVMLGAMFIPWENREKFGRLTLDLRFTGQYHSEGRDYSELFDALGSSNVGSLRRPTWASYKANDQSNGTGQPISIVDQGSQKTYFTGLTDVQAFGSYRGSASVTWQASEIVKFQFGIGYRHDQAHGITMDQPCNPDFKGDLNKSGPCHVGSVEQGQTLTSTGVPNPNYRPTINEIGRRFYVDSSNTLDIFASGVVMF
jgi:hypothetical protein